MSRQVRVGLLVFAGLALFFVALFAIANRSFLFSNTFYLKSEFENVAGLQPGAAVQYQGVSVGRVETVELPEEAGGQITVTMAVRENAQGLIHTNTRALIKTDGLVGNQIIVLENPAGRLAGEVESGDTIPGVEPFDVFAITDQALAAVDTFATVAVEAQQIMQDVQRGEGSLGRLIYDDALYNSAVATAEETQRLMQGLRDDAEAITQLARGATEEFDAILAKVNTGEGTLARILNDDDMYERLLATTDTLQGVVADVRAVTSSAENAANWGALGAYRFSELMEAAKHNFIFKRYFEERGYMDKAPFEIREAALEETYEDLQAKQRELYEWEQRLEAREAELGLDGATSTRPDSLADRPAALPVPQDTEKIGALPADTVRAPGTDN